MRFERRRVPIVPFALLAASACLSTGGGLAARGAASSPPGLPQEGVSVIRFGDAIPGAGVLRRVDFLRVSDSGSWVAEIFSDGETSGDNLILLDGSVFTKEGAILQDPEGASLELFFNLDLNEEGDLVLIAAMDGPFDNFDTGLFLNRELLFQEDDVIVNEALGKGTVWETFHKAMLNDRGQILMVGEVLEPTIPGTKEDVLIRVNTGSAEHTNLDLLAIEGQVFPELAPRKLRDVGNLDHGLAFSDDGDVLFSMVLEGHPATDGVIMLNGRKVAQEGDPAPFPGRTWRDLRNKPMAMNDRGQFLFRASLDTDTDDPGLAATDDVLVAGRIEEDGSVTLEKFVQEGDVLPEFSPLPLSQRGNNAIHPHYVANNGAVYWIAVIGEAPLPADEAIMQDQRVLLRKGSSTIEGVLMESFRSAPNGFHVSRDGRYMVVEVNLEGIGESVAYFDFGTLVPIDACDPTGASLASLQPGALPGESLEFEFDGGQGAGVATALFLSPRRLEGPSGCGVDLGFGEVVIGGPVVHTELGPLFQGEPVTVSVDLPADLSLVDTTWYLQGLFADVDAQLPGEGFRLTNGLRMEIGTP